jgi:TetR/AcrR family transcriptional repressor of lmrAB and yxaGH operons
MKKGDETRARIVEAAVRLFEQRGYAATGLNEILTDSGAPRGSLYHHFPGGKEELAVAVVLRHGDLVRQGLEAVLRSHTSPLRAMTEGLELLASFNSASGSAPGCPVSSIALEMATQSPALREAAEAVFESWRAVVANRLEGAGVPRAKATVRARVLVSTVVGAVVLSRAYGDRGPLLDVKKTLPSLLDV